MLRNVIEMDFQPNVPMKNLFNVSEDHCLPFRRVCLGLLLNAVVLTDLLHLNSMDLGSSDARSFSLAACVRKMIAFSRKPALLFSFSHSLVVRDYVRVALGHSLKTAQATRVLSAGEPHTQTNNSHTRKKK